MAITATKRLQEIVDLLDQKGYVKAKELSQKYQVSMETIRKDLTFLEEKGVVKKEYGGATLATLGTEKNIEFREKQKYDEKKEIATPLFQDKPFIRGYQIEVQGHTTTTEWNGKESVEEYLKKREYEIETSIYLNEGKTDKEYAEELSYIMQEIVESDLVFNISVYTSDDNLIFYSLPEQHSQPDVEVILEKMADVKRQQKTQKDYKEWKKQNQNNETNSD